MKQIIYRYLNESLGIEVYLKSNEDNSWYNIYSSNKIRIISFRIQNEKGKPPTDKRLWAGM